MLPPVLPNPGWRDLIEIAIIWLLFYQLLLFLKGTRAIQVAKGLALLVITALLCQILKLNTIGWLLRNMMALGLVTFIIIFQPELRRALAKIGQGPFRGMTILEEEILGEISDAINYLNSTRVGALIVLERETGLRNYIETGIGINAHLTSQLLISIFTPRTPLHDGAVIVQGDTIVAAACILPLAEDVAATKILGTRHRAAIGISRETDALSIVVSEETGDISVAVDGVLNRNLDPLKFKEILMNFYVTKEKKSTRVHLRRR